LISGGNILGLSLLDNLVFGDWVLISTGRKPESRKEPTSFALRLDDGLSLILGNSRLPDANIGGRHDLGVDYTFEGQN
jgi:hypothetical protein